ncbi:MAG: DUF72 domain-containing protein [Bryobacterales bacterium]|nr:DUF72 domain-containing protein [Bryobacteraceae bacterium]MDW8130812.1 DUF72 domain-containing protein [Bryobacterales bacterium]
MATLLVGCCGWPEARARYFEHFPVVELQQTFYQLPSVALAEKWRREAPASFHFTMKAWQLITHPASSPTYRRLREPLSEKERQACGWFQATPQVWNAWERTAEIARALRAEAVVLQCPASFRPSAANLASLETFFARLGPQEWLLVWEPRGEWPAGIVRDLCRRFDLVHCVDPFQAEPLYGRALYLRLHGRGGYSYRYCDAELEELARKLERWRGDGARPAYVLFNNVYMKEDALRFLRLVG